MATRQKSERKKTSYVAQRGRMLRFEALERRTLLSATNPLLLASGLASDGNDAADGPSSAPATMQFYHIVNYAAAGGTAISADSATASMTAADLIPDASSGPVGYTPLQLRTAYGVSQLSVGINGGAGQTIAIIDAYDDPALVGSTHPSTDSAFAASDFAKFDAAMGLPDPPSFLKVNENGATSPLPAASGTTGWSVEESLDVEWAHAMAPAANIILIEVNSTTDADLVSVPMASMGTAANLANVTVVSMSFGRSENSTDTTLDPDFSTPAGHAPITYLASTGDSGAPGGFPAYSPNVVAVGGTTLNLGSGNVWSSETGWISGGGGRSVYETVPSYQQSAQTSGFREIPDISSDADPNTGVAVYDSYDYGSSTPWEEIGGTSVSSPCWAGLIAIADQLRTSSGLPTLNGRQDTLPALYKLYSTPSSYSADFHDITVGNNGNPPATGYDMVTGIGSPKANLLLPDLVGVSNKGTVAFSASSIAIGTSATVTVADLNQLGQPSLTVTMTSSAGDIETMTLTAQGGGIFKGTIPISAGPIVAGDGILETVPGGTITATYADVNYGGLGQTVNVTAQATTFLPVVINNTTPAAGGTFTLPGPFTYDVNFNESVLASSVTTGSLALSGISGATVSAVTLLNGNTTAQFTLSGITTDGSLTASIAAGAITDPSGNPNTAFTATYYVDLGTAAFPAPLTSTAPKGSLIYSNTTSQHSINPDGNPDTFTLSVDPNQTITVLVTPNGSTLQPSMQLLDPSNNVIGTATAAAAGQDALLQTVATDNSATGTYTIVVSGASSTTGGYTVQVTLNAALEREGIIAGGTDSTLATAQDLTASFLTLGSQGSLAQRGAVVGQTTVASTPDYYSFSASAGDVDTFALENFGTGTLGLALVNSGGATIATGAAGATNVSAVINQFEISAAGTYYLQVEGAAGISYSLVATRNAAFSLQPHSSQATAENISGTLGALGMLGGVGGGSAIQMGLIQDVLPWGINSNTTVATGLGYTVTLIPSSSLASANLSAYSMIVLAGDQSSTVYSAVQANLARIQTYVSAGGVWIVNHAAVGGIDYGYNLLPATSAAFTYSTGTNIDVLAPSSGLINGPGGTITNTTLDGGTYSYHGYTTGPMPAGGTAILDVGGTPSDVVAFDYPDALGHVIADTIPVEYYSGTGNFGIFHKNLFNFGASFAGSSTNDYYSDQLTAGLAVHFATSTPSDDAGEFGNALSPHIELYNSSGTLVASGVVSADGRNETIDYVPTVSGLYTIHVTSKNNTSGEYFLSLGTPIGVAVPANLTQGQGTANGTISVSTAPTSDLVVSLASSDPARLSVPATVTILAGQTSAALPVTPIADGLLHGPETVTITATAPGYAGGAVTVEVHDNVTASLTVTLPQSAHEDAGTVTGTVTVSAAPAQDVAMQLSSGNTSQLTVPTTVILPAGQTSVNFMATLIDDHVIEGTPTPVAVTVQMDNWTPGTTSISVLDDDATLAVSLPASGWEGQTATGKVTLGGTLATPLTVYLASSDMTQLTVPVSVTVPAGQTTVSFTATLIDNGLKTGPQMETVTATASGLTNGTASIIVKDADVDHYTFSAFPANEVAGLPFAATIRAYDILNNPITVYNGTAALSATGQGGPLSVSPTSVTFASGVWTGNVTISTVDPVAKLQINNGAGAVGTSTAINVYPQLQVTSTTPAAGGVFTLPGPFTYVVNFNDPVLPSSVTTTSLTLSGITGATVTGATLLPGNMSVQYTISGISSEGTLTASIAAGSIIDQYGFAGQTFSGSYVTDLANPIQPVAFTSLAPLGGLAFKSAGNSATLYGSADVDDYGFFVQGGQTISAVATPTSPGVALTLALGGGASVTGIAGQSVTLPLQYIAADGTQTLHVSGSGATAFTLDIYRNATLGSLSGGGISNQISIDNSGIVPPGPAASAQGERWAVVGASAPVLAQKSGSLTTEFAENNGQNGNMFDVATNSNPITVTSLDVNLSAGAYTLDLYTKSGTYVGFDTTPSAWTLFCTATVTGAGLNLPTVFTVPNLVLPANATTGFYVTTTGTGNLNYTNGSNTYGNADLTLTSGIGKAYPFGSSFTPRIWNGTINYNVNSGPGTPDVDSYTVNLTGKAGHRVDIVLAGQQGASFAGEQMQLLGTDGSTVLATAVANPLATGTTVTNYNLGILDYLVPADGIYTVRFTSTTTTGTYAIVVSDTLQLDTEPNDLLTNPLRALTVARPALGYLGSADADRYSLSLMSGQQVVLTTATPYDHAGGLPSNALAPKLELYSPSGTLLASNQGGAPDQRNDLLNYTAAATGTYTIRILAASQQGEYIIGVQQPLTIAVPSSATEGDGTLNGTLSIPAPLAADLQIALASSDPTRLTVPGTLTIPAGMTSIALPVTIIDDNLLNGPEVVTITASTAGNPAAAAAITVHDNETATMTVTLPSMAHENAGSVMGMVTASAAPSQNITIQLTSSVPGRLTVPPTVTLAAGQTSVNFTATVIPDTVIEGGPTPVTVTSQMDNWTNGTATINLIDDNATIAVSLPASGWEGQTAAGTVTLGGTSATPITVNLTSSDTTQLSVPASVTVPAGQTTANFTATLIDNGLKTGPQSEQVTGTAGGLTAGTANIIVKDADVDHYTFSSISSPQTDGATFSATASAYDVLDNLITVYNSSVPLSATGQSGTIAVSPASASFASGVWTGSVTVNTVDPAVVLKVSNGAGVSGSSNSFAVQPGAVASLSWSTIAGPNGVNVAFAATLTAKDVNGYTATGFNGQATLSGLVGSSTSTTILGSPTPTASGTGSYTMCYAFTPSSNFLVTAVRHYSGTKVSIWTNMGTLLASQTYTDAPGSWSETTLASPLQLLAGVTYRVAYYTGSYSWYCRTDMSPITPIGTINAAYYTTGDAFPTIVDTYAHWQFVDLRGNLGTFTAVPISPTTANFVNGTWTGNVTVSQAASNMHLHVDDGTGHTADSNTFNVVPAAVAGRYVFYNNSSFDGNNPAANSQDDAAIVTDKTALLPGGTASFANYTSYSRGINGIMMDVQNLAGTPTAADFVFKVGNSNTPGAWTTAPAPTSITVRSGAGTGGSSRIEIVWPDNAIAKEWLQVTLLADAATGLAANDVSYWGNAVGDTGNSPSDAYVNANDEILTRHYVTASAGIANDEDFDRNGAVDSGDVSIVRQNGTNFMTALKLITVPLTSGANDADAATWTGDGPDANWSTAANWGGTPLTSGMSVSFTGSGGTVTNDLTAMTLGGIAFPAQSGPFVLSGNAVTLSGNISSVASAMQTVALPITLAGGDTVLNSDSGTLNVTGDISSSGGAYGIQKFGAGTVVLSGNNSYAGGTIVAEGKLVVASDTALPDSTGLTVGNWDDIVPNAGQADASLPDGTEQLVAAVAAPAQLASALSVTSSPATVNGAVAAAALPQQLQFSAAKLVFAAMASSSPSASGSAGNMRAAAAVLADSLLANTDATRGNAFARLQALDALLADWQ